MARTMLKAFTLTTLLLACTPNYLPIRVSTAQLIQQSDATYAHPAADIAAKVLELFQARGFPVIDKRTVTPTVTYYVFQGARKEVTSTKGYIGRYGGEIHSENYTIGSWFVARVEDVGGTSTKVFIYGKPTVNNTAVCSDADVRLKESDYQCSDTRIQEGAPEWSMVTGKEEANTVKGVFVELDQAMKAP